MKSDDRLATGRFPRSSAYHTDWVLTGISGGANSLWLTEGMQLRAGMRVLDLGCGMCHTTFVCCHSVHPTRHNTNLNLLVGGLSITLAAPHAKIRRDGYRTSGT